MVRCLLIFIFLFSILLLPSPVYAQVGGTGAAVLEPIQPLWQLSRNIAYLAMVVILIIIGLMIMFRAKLGQQAVVGLQQALPGVIIALIVITFSFFIASLIIDLAFILARIFGVAILTAVAPGVIGDVDAANRVVTDILNQRNFFDILAQFMQGSNIGSAAGTVGNALAPVFKNDYTLIPGTLNVSGTVILALLTGFMLQTFGGIVGTVIGFVGGGLTLTSPETGAAFLVFAVLFLAMLFNIFSLFMSIIGAFVAIIANVIFGPLILLSSAFPGKSGNIMGWVRSLTANVLVFPALFAIFILVAVILNLPDPAAPAPPWGICLPGGVCPPAIGAFNQQLPLLAGLPDQFMRFILAFGLLLLTPGIADFIRRSLGAPQAQEFTKAIQGNIQSGQKEAGSSFGSFAKKPQAGRFG